MKANAALDKFGRLSLAEQVQRAMPFARKCIEEGVNYYAREDCAFHKRVGECLGDKHLERFFDEESERAIGDWNNRLEAARAIGIAIGLMLRPEAFTKGGVR